MLDGLKIVAATLGNNMMKYAVYYIAGSFWDEYMNQNWEFFDLDPDSLGMWCMGGEL